MPVLPGYQDIEKVTPQPSGNVVSLNAPVGRGLQAIGQSFGAAAQDMQEAASMVMQTNSRQDEMVAEAALNRLHAASLDLESNQQSGFKNLHGENAVGSKFLEDYQQKFKDQSEAISNGLTNSQKQMFARREPIAALQFQSSLLGHQARETDRFNEQTETTSMDLARRQMFQSPGNPLAYESGVAKINWAIDQRAQRMGWSPEVTADTKAKYLDSVHQDTVEIMVAKDPFGSLALMNKRLGIGGDAANTGNPAIDSLDPGKLVALRHRATLAVDQADNKVRIEQDRRLKVAEDAYKGARDLALTGVAFSPDYERQLKADTIGTPWEQPIDGLVKSSLVGASFGSKSLPEQNETLRQLDLKAVQTGTDPETAKILQHARSITATQTAAYKENPWEASARFARLQPVQEQQISDASQVTKLVSDRLPLMAGVEAASGMTVSPLQPHEADAFAEKIKGLPDGPWSDVIGSIGAQLSAPRIAALADQVDKSDKILSLALKLGTDGTNAGRKVSMLVRRGATLLADKAIKRDDSVFTGWRKEISGLIRGTLGDSRAEQDAIDAAYFVRASMDSEGTAVPGFGLNASNRNAVKMVLGEPIERAGVKTFAPKGMDEGTFNGMVRAYTPEVLASMVPGGKVYIRGQERSVSQLATSLPDMGLTRDGQKRYIPVASGALVTLDKAGTIPLALEIR